MKVEFCPLSVIPLLAMVLLREDDRAAEEGGNNDKVAVEDGSSCKSSGNLRILPL